MGAWLDLESGKISFNPWLPAFSRIFLIWDLGFRFSDLGSQKEFCVILCNYVYEPAIAENPAKQDE